MAEIFAFILVLALVVLDTYMLIKHVAINKLQVALWILSSLALAVASFSAVVIWSEVYKVRTAHTPLLLL